jgi:F420-non-reducing hydrogenase small subunit
VMWTASCGGCEVAILDIHEKILDLAAAADIVIMPLAFDGKYGDIVEMEDGEIDVTLFNGAIRSSENEELAHLFRQKSKVLVAFGSCSHMGGIPGLANTCSRADIFKTVYETTDSTDNPNKTYPQTEVKVAEGEIRIPTLFNTVKTLQQTVDVDYFMPGCPPHPKRIWEVVLAIVSGNLPPKGSVVGASNKNLCDTCPREKSEKKIKKFYSPHEIQIDPKKCFLEQGIICVGPATRSGCEEACINSNMPCRGCYGPPPDITDQGTKMLSAVASIIDSGDEKEIDEIIKQIPDPLGLFYRFALPLSTLRRTKQ